MWTCMHEHHIWDVMKFGSVVSLLFSEMVCIGHCGGAGGFP